MAGGKTSRGSFDPCSVGGYRRHRVSWRTKWEWVTEGDVVSHRSKREDRWCRHRQDHPDVRERVGRHPRRRGLGAGHRVESRHADCDRRERQQRPQRDAASCGDDGPGRAGGTCRAHGSNGPPRPSGSGRSDGPARSARSTGAPRDAGRSRSRGCRWRRGSCRARRCTRCRRRRGSNWATGSRWTDGGARARGSGWSNGCDGGDRRHRCTRSGRARRRARCRRRRGSSWAAGCRGSGWTPGGARCAGPAGATRSSGSDGSH